MLPDDSPDVTIVLYRAGDGVVMSVGGVLDGRTAPSVVSAARDLVRDYPSLEVELRYVTHIDSDGVRAIRDAAALASEHERRFHVRPIGGVSAC